MRPEGAPGGLAIDAKVRPGDRLRFHVRDGSAARGRKAGPREVSARQAQQRDDARARDDQHVLRNSAAPFLAMSSCPGIFLRSSPGGFTTDII